MAESASHPDVVCAQCGRAVPAGAPFGQCPRCLLQLAGAAPWAEAEAGNLAEVPELRRFGDYTLIEEIARGGMGVVYRARQESLGREVAVKMVLAGELAGPESLRMFRREAQAAANLHHPNIVPVYEIGEHELQHYFSMRLVPEGRTIATWARSCRADRRALADAVARSARAVAHAHAHGVLHRDLKPSNILWDDLAGPQVTDFGLAKLMDEADGGGTMSARVLGSPNYMAPEQAAGRTAEITTATDVYGLGAVLYELLTGRAPFRGTTPLDTLRRVAEELPEPLEDVPEDLKTICLRCLEKEPERRYRSAASLADDLERWLRDEPILARPASAGERLRKWVRRRPVHAALVGTAVLSLVALVAGQIVHTRRTEAARRAAESASRQLASQLRRVEWEQAEEALAAGRTPDAMAMFARFLRETPRDTAVAARLRSMLETRAFPRPLIPAMVHGKAVSLARMSSDFRRLFTLDADGVLRAWDLATGALEKELSADLGNLVLRVLPEGERLLVRTRAGRFQVWDTGRWERDRELGMSGPGPRNWGLSDDGRRLSVLPAEGGVEVWDPAAGMRLASTNRPHADLVIADLVIAGTVGPGGETLLRGFRQGLWLWRPAEASLVPLIDPAQPTKAAHADWARQRAYVSLGLENVDTNVLSSLDLRTGREVVRTPAPMNWTLLQPSPDGERLLVSVFGIGANVLDAATLNTRLYWFGESLIEANVAADRAFRVAFRALHDGTGRLYDLSRGMPLMEPVQHGGIIPDYQLTPDGRRLVTASQDGTARLWDLGMRPPDTTVVDAGSWIFHFAPNADHTRLAVALKREVVLHDIATGALVWRTRIGEEIVNRVTFSPDGRWLAVASSDRVVCVLAADTGKVLWRQGGYSAEVYRAVFSSDGRRLATSGVDAWARVYEADTGRVLIPALPHGGELTDVTFSPDGRLVATSSVDATARIWDADTGQPATPPLAHRGTVYSVRFSPDGQRLLTASTDRTAQLWDVRSGARVGNAFGADTGLRGAVFSPDARRVLIYTMSGARIFDAATAKPLTSPMRHGKRVIVAAFSPDGRWVVTASEDRTARLWDATTGLPFTDPLIGEFYASWAGWMPDGRHFLTAGHDGRVRRWSVPRERVAPAWMPDLAEALAGKRSEGEGGSGPLPRALWDDLRRVAMQTDVTDWEHRWLRWFLVGRLEAPDSLPPAEE